MYIPWVNKIINFVIMKTYLKILIVLITFLSINGCVMRDGKIQRVSFSGAAIKTMDDVEKQRGYLSNEKN